MSLALAITAIVVLDVLLLAGLALAMASTRKLTPHRPAWLHTAVEPQASGIDVPVELRRAA
jgi:hypothetical protein